MKAGEGRMMIGLEIHAQLLTASKLFCFCPAGPTQSPNTSICPVCTAQPGAKPAGTNARAMEQAVRIALMVGCTVPEGGRVAFLRKHYFYPDLPNNYQRTSTPVGADGLFCGARIREVHLEEDPGRYDIRKDKVDLSRCGTPLAEIVTDPDFSTPEEVRLFLKKLSTVLDYLGATRMEAGSTRIDVNVSTDGGRKVEVKNVNSFHNVYRAIKYEVIRQKNMRRRGLEILQETCHFDELQKITISSRQKESADDYRYFPDPDIVPIELSPREVARICADLPESPDAKAQRLQGAFSISAKNARALSEHKDLAALFEAVRPRDGKRAEACAEFLLNDTLRVFNYLKKKGLLAVPEKLEYEAEFFSQAAEAVASGKMTGKLARRLVQARFEAGRTGPADVETRQVEGAEIERAVHEALKGQKGAAEDYCRGKKAAIHSIVGEVMKALGYRADPKKVITVLEKILNSKQR